MLTRVIKGIERAVSGFFPDIGAGEEVLLSEIAPGARKKTLGGYVPWILCEKEAREFFDVLRKEMVLHDGLLNYSGTCMPFVPAWFPRGRYSSKEHISGMSVVSNDCKSIYHIYKYAGFLVIQ